VKTRLYVCIFVSLPKSDGQRVVKRTIKRRFIAEVILSLCTVSVYSLIIVKMKQLQRFFRLSVTESSPYLQYFVVFSHCLQLPTNLIGSQVLLKAHFGKMKYPFNLDYFTEHTLTV